MVHCLKCRRLRNHVRLLLPKQWPPPLTVLAAELRVVMKIYYCSFKQRVTKSLQDIEDVVRVGKSRNLNSLLRSS